MYKINNYSTTHPLIPANSVLTCQQVACHPLDLPFASLRPWQTHPLWMYGLVLLCHLARLLA